LVWLWLAAAIALLLWFAALSRKRKQRAAVAGLRAEFPPIARMHLVAACPKLDGVLDEASLRMLFNWMLIELYRRTGSSGLGELMQWSIETGEVESRRLVAEVSRAAVDRLPQPVLAIIDECGGRTVAGVLLDDALNESGRRIGPELNRKYV
jgi:hypothetical protein